MYSVQIFLENMEKPLLRTMHAKAYGQQGLLNNSRILSDTVSFFADVKRFAAFFEKLEPWQKTILALIYGSGPRGLELSELRLAVPAEKRDALEPFTLASAKDLYLWRAKTERGTFVYRGFLDFAGCVPLCPGKTGKVADIRYTGYMGMLDWHVCEVLASVKLGKLRMNGTGNLHRRSLQVCEETLTFSKAVSPEAAHDEIVLILQFLSGKRWIYQENSLLHVAPVAFDFLKRSGFRLRNEILVWWLAERFHGDTEHFKLFLRALDGGMSAASAERLFWPFDPSCCLPGADAVSVVWSSLARPLRELWMLGFVDFAVDKEQRIVSIAASDWSREWISSEMSPVPGSQISTLPNFEMIVSVSSAPRVLFMAACLASVQNDEPFLRFILKRETYMEGLMSGFAENEAKSFAEWIAAPENVSLALAEWNASHFGASFRTVRLLKISNDEVRKNLEKFPQFVEMTEEVIPGYGFVIKTEFEKKIRELLHHYGLEPAEDSVEAAPEAIRGADWNKEFWLPWPAEAQPDYGFKAEVDEAKLGLAMGATKYGGEYRKLDTFDMFKVLRYAHSTGTPLGARIRNSDDKNSLVHEIHFVIRALHLSKNPFYAEVALQPGNTPSDVPLESISEIRLLYGNTSASK